MDDNVIKVSFKENPNEQQLLNDILEECSIIGKSAWIKLAAKEKLQRDRYNRCTTNPIIKANSQSQIINSLDEMFKAR